MAENRKLYEFTWPGGKDRAFTMSYDDGVRQDARLTALMRKYGLKGTFNLNSGRFSYVGRANIFGVEVDTSTFSREEIPAIYEGFEIATHGRSHSGLKNLGPLAAMELLEDRRDLEALSNQFVIGHAYPYGTFDENTKTALRASGIRYARTIRSTHGFDLPRDFLEWDPTCHHTEKETEELLKTFCETRRYLHDPQLFYLWGHSYELDQFEDWDRMEELLAYVSQFKEEIWFASNGEICRYLEAAQRLELSADGSGIYNPSAVELWFDAAVWGERRIRRIGPGELVKLEDRKGGQLPV